MEYLCIVCRRAVRNNSKALECELCLQWCHIKCGIDITPERYDRVVTGEETFDWVCEGCDAPPSVDSGFIHSPEDSSLTFDPDVTPPDYDTPVKVKTEESEDSDSSDDYFSLERPLPDFDTPIRSSVTFDLDDAFDDMRKDEDKDRTTTNVYEYTSNSVSYSIIDNGTRRGRAKLVDSIGYSYTGQRTACPFVRSNMVRVTWRCSVRNKSTCCRATVFQRATTFMRGDIEHSCHPSTPPHLKQ